MNIIVVVCLGTSDTTRWRRRLGGPAWSGHLPLSPSALWGLRELPSRRLWRRGACCCCCHQWLTQRSDARLRRKFQ
jgi:hypothetical protein